MHSTDMTLQNNLHALIGYDLHSAHKNTKCAVNLKLVHRNEKQKNKIGIRLLCLLQTFLYVKNLCNYLMF